MADRPSWDQRGTSDDNGHFYCLLHDRLVPPLERENQMGCKVGSGACLWQQSPTFLPSAPEASALQA